MTQRELDQTKGELVRALRRRASELDATVSPTSSTTNRRRHAAPAGSHRPAFFVRESFLSVALAPTAASAP